jgi:hypothetical protein
MYHFGRPIQDYFPWFQYNGLDAPPLNEELFKQVRNCVPYKFLQLVTLWIKQEGIYISGLEFMSSKELCYDTIKDIAWLSLSHDSIKFTPESFLDIEKIRLMYLLGVKEDAQKYLNFIDLFMFLNEQIEYYQVLIDDFETGYKIKLTNIKEISNRFDIYSKIKFTDKELTDIIQNYEGNNKFLTSLRLYLQKNTNLTSSQLYAASDRRNFKDLGVIIDEDKICIELEHTPSKKVDDELKTMIHRLKLNGFTILEFDYKTIIYK